MSWIQTIVPLTANTSTPLLSANPWRERLRFQITAGGPVTIAPGVVTVTAGNGMVYNGPPSAGAEGSSDDFQLDCSKDAFSAIATAGSTVTIWEFVQNRGIAATSGVGSNNLGATP